MRKIRYFAIGSAFGLALIGQAWADDPLRDDQTRQDRPLQLNDQTRHDNPQERNNAARQEPPSMQNRSDSPVPDGQARPDPKARPDPATTGSSAEYSAELNQCDRLRITEKMQCVEAVKKKYGQL